MLLALDVGNTNIVIGILDGDKLIKSGRISTDIYKTEDEYAMNMYSFLRLNHALDIDGAIISSVVPALVRTLVKAVNTVCDVDALVVGPGADLVVGAVAAKEKYPQPTIIFDMGTATTGFVLDRDANFIGGIITTGLKTSINALTAGAALLPQIDISAPKKVIGTNSIECMKSGCVIGTACMLDGLIDKFEEELGEKATVIVTGGLGQAIAEQCSHDMIIDKNLLIDGLKIIYNKNIDTRR